MAFERRILTRYDASTAGFDRGTRRVEAQLTRLQRTADSRLTAIDNRFRRAGQAAARFGATIAGLALARGIGQTRQYAESWNRVARALTSAGFAVDGNREKLAQLAIRVRGDLASTSQAVARFARVTGDDLDSSIRRVETLQKLLAVGGATSAEAGSATLQLTQGLRANQLGGEELRAIREAAPIEFLDALARAAGGTREELKQLGADGRLTSQVIKDALDDLAQTADTQFGQLAISGTEAFEVLSTGFSAFFGNLDQQLGATAGLNQFLASTGTLLTDNAESARTFATALEVAAVAAVSLAGGRGLGALNNAFQRGIVSRQETILANERLVASERLAVLAAQERVSTTQRRLAASQRAVVAAQAEVRATGASTKALALQSRATATQEKAYRSAAAASSALTASQAQLTAAQTALATSTSLTARSFRALQTTVAFFGGLPGLIIGAVSALYLFTDAFQSNAAAASELRQRFQDIIGGAGRVREVNASIRDDTEALERANDRLTDAINQQGGASEDTARRDIAALDARIAKNKELREQINQANRANLEAARAELRGLERQLEQLFISRGDVLTRSERNALGQPGGGAILQSAEFQERLNQAIRDTRAEISRLQDAGESLTPFQQAVVALSGSIADVGIEYQRAADAVEDTRPTDAVTAQAEAIGKAVDAANEAIAKLDAEAFQKRRQVEIEVTTDGDAIARVGAEAAAAFDAALAEAGVNLGNLEPVIRAAFDGARQRAVDFARETESLRQSAKQTEQGIDALNKAVDDYRRFSALATGSTEDLVSEYGSADRATRELVDSQRELARSDALRGASEVVQGLVEQIGNARSALGLTREEADAFIAALSDPEGPRALNDQADVLAEIRRRLEEQLRVQGELPPEARRLLDVIIDVEGAMRDAGRAAGDIASGLDSSTAAAVRLANEMARVSAVAANAAAEIQRAQDRARQGAREAQIRLQNAGNPVATAVALETERLSRTDISGLDPILQEGLNREREEAIDLTREQAEAEERLAVALRSSRSAGGGGGRGGGGRAVAEREKPDILEGQRASNQALAEELEISERVLRIREGLVNAGLDQETVNRQVASARESLTAILERNRIEAELLKRAQEEEIELTPALRAQISGLADEYLKLTQAQQGAQEAEERLAETQREAAELAEERGRAIEDLGDRFTNLIQGAESLEDALKKVAIELANLVAQAIAGRGPLAALFGGGSGSGIFGSIFGGGGSGSFGSLMSTPTSQLPVLRFHKGGVVGRGGTPAGPMPAELFATAPRLHSGGMIGPNEVPAILERGEIVVPKNIGADRSAPNVTINQPVTVNGSGLTEDQLNRAVQSALARERPRMLAEVQARFLKDGNYLSGAG